MYLCIGVLVLAATGYLLWLFLSRFVRIGRGRLPPGPCGVPILGALPFMGKHPQLKLTEWGRKYGSVYSLFFGQKLAIVLNDYDTIRRAFYEDKTFAFSGRPSDFVYDTMTSGDKMSEGLQWRDERRFFLRTFHELGARNSASGAGGLSSFEQHCRDEAACLIQQLCNGNEKVTTDPALEIATSVANIIWALIFGQRLGRSNSLLHDFLRNQNAITNQLMQVGPVQALPFLRYIKPIRTQWKCSLQAINTQRRLTKPFIETVMTKFNKLARVTDSGDDTSSQSEEDDGGRPNSVIEHMLAHRAALSLDSPMHVNYTDEKIQVAVNNLFGAGTETTVTTLKWAVLYLTHFPEAQQKMFQEIDTVVGVEHPVSWSDGNRLPYCEAFLLETMRRASLLPLGIVRRTLNDVQFDGYFIPKDTLVFPNLWNVHRSEENFRNPLEFKPVRMLDVNTDISPTKVDDDVVVRRDDRTFGSERSKCIPFSIGKRACVGETIARMTMFVLLTNLVQKLKFVPPSDSNEPLPSIDEFTTGITVQPLPYKLHIVPRAETSRSKSSSASVAKLVSNKFSSSQLLEWSRQEISMRSGRK